MLLFRWLTLRISFLEVCKNTASNRLKKTRTMEKEKEEGIKLLHETKAVIKKHPPSNTKTKFFANKRKRTLENTNESVNKQEGTKSDQKGNNKKQKLFWKIHDLK